MSTATKKTTKPSVAKKVNAMKKVAPATQTVTQSITETAHNISDSVRQAVENYDWDADVISVGVGVGKREVHVAASTKEILQVTGIAAIVTGVCYAVMK